MSIKRVLINSSYYTIGSVLTRSIGFFMLPVYTHFLSTHEYGQVNYLNSFIQVMIFIASFSLFVSVPRFYVKYRNDDFVLKRLIGTIYISMFIFGGIFFVVMMLLRNTISPYLFPDIEFYPLVVIAIVTVVFMTIHSMHQQVLIVMARGMQTLRVNAAVFLSQAIINVFLIVVLRLGALGILLSQLSVFVVYAIYAYFDLKLKNVIVLCWDKKLLIEALKYSVPLMPHHLSTRLASVISKLFITTSYTIALVGVYGVALQFASIVEVIQVSVNKALKPHIFKILDSKKDVHDEVYDLTILVTISFSFMYILIGGYSSILIDTFLPSDYHIASHVIPIVLIGYALKAVYYFYLNVILYYLKTSKKVFLATVSGSIVNILLMAFLIPAYGIYGAAWAFSISKLVTLLLVLLVARNFLYKGIVLSDLMKIMTLGLLVMYISFKLPFVLKTMFVLFYFMMVLSKKRALIRRIFLQPSKINIPFKEGTYKLEKVSSSAYRIVTHDKAFFLKLYDYIGMSRFLDNFRRNKSLAFLNEIHYNLHLENQSFYYPKLLKTDQKNYMVFEEVFMTYDYDREELLNVLIHMQHSNIPQGFKGSKKVLWRMKQDFSIHILRWSRSLNDFTLTMKCIKAGISSIFLKKSKKSYLTHFDLMDCNNVFKYKGKIGLCDFEYMRMENKWYLVDVVDICFNRETFVFDYELFELYVEKSDILERESREVINRQVKYLLIRRLLGIAINVQENNEKLMKCKEYIRKLLE